MTRPQMNLTRAATALLGGCALLALSAYARANAGVTAACARHRSGSRPHGHG